MLVIWIAPEGYLPQFGQHSGFDPYGFGWPKAAVIGLIAMRLIGAAVVVPVMEELFWRSFFMRYLINPNFRSVSMGAFTWFSFMGVAIMFGLEHHRVIIGIIAGLFYGLLLVHQKKLNGVILAHGVTNLGLGIYVLADRQLDVLVGRGAVNYSDTIFESFSRRIFFFFRTTTVNYSNYKLLEYLYRKKA